jgi:cyclopropane fatty-acyl-phospholipid synthase-like methyltransferase
MKYSCALYEEDGRGGIKGTLDEAEDRMLESYVQKAQLVDGMSILDLGFVSLFTLFLDRLGFSVQSRV